MFPTKNMFEGDEMNRFFSIENDAVPNLSLFQSPLANRSSSSADSISPENYFEIPFQYHQDIALRRSRVTPSPNPTISSYTDFFESPVERSLFTTSPQPLRASQIYESPRTCYDSTRRPIVGRKILGASHAKNETDLFSDWTPPSSQPKSYELFPRSEEQFMPTASPTPSITRPPSVRSNYSNTHSNRSDALSNYSKAHSNYSDALSNYGTAHSNYGKAHSNYSNEHSNYINTHSNYTNLTQKSFGFPQLKPQFGGQICTFCRKNGERPEVYENHCVKEKVGGKYIVTCPILRSHRCQQCGVSGDDAHTITYCPVLRSKNNGMPLVSTTVKLKNTPMKSNGKRRYTGQIARI